MVYRENARNPQREQAGPSDVLMRVDVSGRPGVHGAGGHPGGSGASGGHDGGRGGDAGAAGPGQSAGAIHVRLSEPQAGRVRLQGRRVAPDGSETAIDETCEVGDLGFVDLVARGGRGGDGGDGGRGGDGGSGGRATSGAPGGVGGTVVVRVHERDTHLLMLLRRDVGGGDGGVPGVNGAGGSSGAGGAGGSSHSWTETETYRDSQGHTRTRTRHHRKPGGSRGARGRPGSHGSAVVTAGAEGTDGRYRIEVEGVNGGVTAYPERYDVRLMAFEHVSANEDGIYEPGERVRVSNLRVANVGGMPTPAHRSIIVYLRGDPLIHPEDEHLELPRSLPAAHETTLTGTPLHFRLGDYTPTGPGDALDLQQSIRQAAYVPAVERGFTNYETEGSVALGRFMMSFPTELSGLTGLGSLAGGQATALRFTVVNNSSRAFGQKSELERCLRLKLAFHESELDDAAIVAHDPDGRSISLQAGHVREIPRIEAGEALSFEYVLGVAEEAPEYAAARLWVSLELGRIDSPTIARAVQHRAHEIRVAGRYQHREGARVLLVVNHTTSREVLASWHRAAESLGFVMDVVDLSYEGRLDPLAPRSDGPSLLSRIDGGTVIVLNDLIETPSGPVPAASFVDQGALAEALRLGLDVAFVGDPADLRALLPMHAALPARSFSAERALLDAVAETRDPVDFELLLHRIGFFFEEPGPELVAERALSLSKRLIARFPSRRFVVVHETDVDQTHEGYLIRRWRAGHLRVVSAGDADSGRVLEARVPEARRRAANYAESAENLTTMLLARGFDELNALMLRGAAEEPRGDEGPLHGRTRALFDAMVVDLATEQEALLTARFRAGLDAEGVRGNLPRLRSMVTAAKGRVAPLSFSHPLADELCRLIGRMRFYAGSQVRLWEWLPPLFFFSRAVLARRETRRLLDELLEAMLIDGVEPERAILVRHEAEERITAVVDALKERFRDDRHVYAADLLLEPIAGDWLTTHAERRRHARERVLSRPDHDALGRHHELARERRVSVEGSIAGSREQLLRQGPRTPRGTSLRVEVAPTARPERTEENLSSDAEPMVAESAREGSR